MQRKLVVDASGARRVPEGVAMAEVGWRFDDFVVEHGPPLLRFAYVLVGDRALAEDLVQEALLKAHRRWDVHGPAEYPEAYVRRVVVNEFIRWRRRRSSGERVGPVPEQGERDTASESAERDLVWRSLRELPARQRAVLVLRYYDARSDAEIAAVLGCAEGTVRSLAARAFEMLRRDPRLARASETGGISQREER
jgi:RNA polymerase sigma-70 factor (sigma-E family)